MSAYADDFHAWAYRQADLLKTRRFDCLDIENLAEEIEAMGRSEFHALRNRLAVLIAHLLKYRFQPNMRSRSWNLTIDAQREEIQILLAEMPSLKSKLNAPDFFPTAWKLGVVRAVKETALEKKTFPAEPCWDLAQVLDTAFFPD